MGADQNIDWRFAAASVLDWWRDAGIDALVEETPRDWTAAPEPPKPISRAQAVAEPVAVAVPLPEDLEAFVSWRIGADAPEADWPGKAVAAQGSPAADMMIVIDLPEREDADSGILMSGPAGRLFDRMLAAIGRDRDSVYIVPVCAKRPVAGRIAPEIEGRLNEVVRHHVKLMSPKRLLLLGNAPSRALLGADASRARGGLQVINLNGAQAPGGGSNGAIRAVASFHPRFLIERPAAKAEAWKDLQMLIGDLEK